MSLRRTNLAPDAQILVDSWQRAGQERHQKELQDSQQAAALNQMLTGQMHQADLQQQAKQREGAESLGALNEFLRGSPEIADRLGRRTEGPMAEGVAGPGSPQFNPYRAEGAGAPMLADFVKGEITNASAESRAAAQQNAEMLRLLLKQQADRENLEFTEGGKDRRLDVTEGGQDRRLDVREGGLDRRFKLGESGKNLRNERMSGAIAGEATLRTQMGNMENYIKAIDSELMAMRLETMINKDPAMKAAAQARMAELTQLRQEVQAQFGSMLQPRTPTVSQPAAPAAPAAPSAPRQIETWGRGPDGKLVPVR